MPKEAQLVSLIPVKKMDRAVRFYTKKLGASVVMRPKGEMGKWWASIQVGAVGAWLVVPEKAEKRSLSYLTLVVADIKGYVAGLKRRGVRFARAQRMSKETKVDGSIAWESFGGSAFFKDSEGNLLMVWQSIGPA